MSGVGRRFSGSRPMLAISLPLLVLCGVVLALEGPGELGAPLTAVLALCAVIGTRVSFDIEGTLFWDGSFLPLICSAALLGPAPAVAITVLSELAVWHRERYRARVLPLNLVGTVVPNLLAASAMAEIGRDASDPLFYAVLGLVVCGSILLNAFLVTALAGLLYDAPILERLSRHRGIAAPIAVNVVLAMGAVAVYRAEGASATAFVLGGVFVFAFVSNRLARDREQRVRINALAASRGHLVAQILEAEDRARRLLADEVHDNLVQTLLAAKQDLNESSDGDEWGGSRVLQQLEQAIQQARSLIRATHPSVLEQVGLEPALRAIAEHAASRENIAVEIALAEDAVGVHDRIVFSAARELLTNAAKHSGAGRVAVRIDREGDGVRLLVRDDGVGFELRPTAELVESGHIGLVSLIERVEAVGGHLQVVNRHPGTDVLIVLPASTELAPGGWDLPPALTSVSQH